MFIFRRIEYKNHFAAFTFGSLPASYSVRRISRIPPFNDFFERRFRILEYEIDAAIADYADGVFVALDFCRFGFTLEAGI